MGAPAVGQGEASASQVAWHGQALHSQGLRGRGNMQPEHLYRLYVSGSSSAASRTSCRCPTATSPSLSRCAAHNCE
eukprot:365084-Chlamydomonas_euryale.AAC.24